MPSALAEPPERQPLLRRPRRSAPTSQAPETSDAVFDWIRRS